MKDEFARARDWVANSDNNTESRGQTGLSLDWPRRESTSVFETNIRIVGGLLSAHSLSGDSIFLKRAEEVARQLLQAFQTPTGLPVGKFRVGATAGGSSNTILPSALV